MIATRTVVRGIAGTLVLLLAAPLARAVTLCTSRKGVVVARDTCRKKETPVDVASLVPQKPAVAVRVRATAAIQVPYHVSSVAVPFSTVDFDTDGFFKPLSSSTTLVAPRDGVYTITATVEWDRPDLSNTSMAGFVLAQVLRTASVPDRVIGQEITPFQRVFIAQSISAVVRLVAGEGIGLFLANETGDTLTAGTVDPGITTMAMVWNGP